MISKNARSSGATTRSARSKRGGAKASGSGGGAHPLAPFCAQAGTVSGDGTSGAAAPRSWEEIYDGAASERFSAAAGPIGPRYCNVAAPDDIPA